jgi:molybdenum-dependent DNA-binding transcriptional regulator ModE
MATSKTSLLKGISTMHSDDFKYPKAESEKAKKPLVLEQRMDQMLDAMMRFQEAVGEKFATWEAMADVERKHVDAVLNQLSRGQESLKADLIYVFREMISAYEQNTKNEQLRQNERIEAHQEKVTSNLTYMDSQLEQFRARVSNVETNNIRLEKRVEDLEEKPLKDAGKQMMTIKDKFLFAIVGSGISVVLVFGQQIVTFLLGLIGLHL